MRAERPIRPNVRGFTLIELLVAIVLLGGGLLAFQSLGVVAARTVWQADRTTRSAAVASEWVEDAVALLRQGYQPPDFSCTLDDGDRIERRLDLSDPALPRVTVTMTPEPRGGTERSSEFATSVFLSTPTLAPAHAAQTPCP